MASARPRSGIHGQAHPVAKPFAPPPCAQPARWSTVVAFGGVGLFLVAGAVLLVFCLLPGGENSPPAQDDVPLAAAPPPKADVPLRSDPSPGTRPAPGQEQPQPPRSQDPPQQQEPPPVTQEPKQKPKQEKPPTPEI